jgi:hypothetical protein
MNICMGFIKSFDVMCNTSDTGLKVKRIYRLNLRPTKQKVNQ